MNWRALLASAAALGAASAYPCSHGLNPNSAAFGTFQGPASASLAQSGSVVSPSHGYDLVHRDGLNLQQARDVGCTGESTEPRRTHTILMHLNVPEAELDRG